MELVIMLDPPTINARRSMQALFSAMSRARPLVGAPIERAKAWAWFRCEQLQKLSTKLRRFWNYPRAKRGAVIQRRWTLIEAKLRSLTEGVATQLPAAPSMVDRWSGEPTLWNDIHGCADLEICSCDVELCPEASCSASLCTSAWTMA